MEIYAKQEEMESLLKQVTCDCKDDGNSFLVKDRIDVIKAYLENTAYQLLAEEDLFLLYGKDNLVQGKPVVLISSHIDCVYESCFCETNGDYYHGTFDNSFTNAAILYLLKNHELPDNVVIAFTGDEEHDSAGAIALNVFLTRHGCPIRFAIVLDVTNAGWKEEHLFAIENDLGIDLLTAYQIIKTLEPFNGKYTFLHNAEPDETWDYDEYGIPCMTLSAPVGGNMHGEEGVFIRKQTMPVYCKVLESLVKTIAYLNSNSL